MGEENKGLAYMFIMMNAARFAVGLEGVAIAERAFQRALAYAKERMQGRDLAGGGTVPIIRHPDVRRMLMLMKSQTEAMRALAYVVAAALDVTARHPDAKVREQNQAFVDLMIPVVKGWSTETGIEVASLGVQVHGGMGFIEETGAAQHLRDARITTIYEGTTGIQANDLVGRKIAREGGATAKAWLAHLKAFDAELAKSANADIKAMRASLAAGAAAVGEAVDYIVANAGKDVMSAFAGAVPFLKLMGIVAGGWQMARAALAAEKKSRRGRQGVLRGEDRDRALLRRPGPRAGPGAGGHRGEGRQRRDGGARRLNARRLENRDRPHFLPVQAEEAPDALQQVRLRRRGRVRQLQRRLGARGLQPGLACGDHAAHLVGDLGARQQQSLERGAVKPVTLDVGARDHRRVARLAGEQPHLAEELARAHAADDARRRARAARSAPPPRRRR